MAECHLCAALLSAERGWVSARAHGQKDGSASGFGANELGRMRIGCMMMRVVEVVTGASR